MNNKFEQLYKHILFEQTNHDILTYQQFELIRIYNQQIANTAHSNRKLYNVICRIISQKPRIQLADNPDVTIPTVGLLLTYSENNHTRLDTIKKVDGTIVYYNIVFPLIYDNIAIPGYQTSATPRKEYYQIFHTYGDINILVQKEGQLISKSLADFWHFDGTYQGKLYPRVFEEGNEILKPNFIKSILRLKK